MKNLLKQIRSFNQNEVLFLGLGNDVLGDDGAGPYFISLLENSSAQHNFKFIDCGTVVESFISKIIPIKPKLIVFIDAANFGAPPGTLKNTDLETIVNSAVSTHALPLTVTVKFLQSEMSPPPQFLFLGVQAANLNFGAPLTAEVKTALESFLTQLI